jgi:DNA primase
MPKSSFIDFKAVKAAVRMEQVLEHYGLSDHFKKSGDSLSGPCPIHKGSNPTQFRVSISKNIWNCFSECKNGGNVLDFIAQMEDVSIHAAALKAIEWFRLDEETLTRSSRETSNGDTAPDMEKPKAAAAPKKEVEKAGPNKALKFRLEKLEREHPFLAERGLKPETIETFGVGFCAKGMMAGRIAIPIANDKSEVVAYAGRFPGEPSEDTPKYKLPPGFRKSLELFNIDRSIKEPAESPLVIVEGFFDCMSLHQNGCRKVVGLMGTSLSAEQEDLILRHTSENAHVIVMLDEDDAGRGSRTEIAARLALHHFVRVHRFAKEGEQPRNLDADAVSKLLASGRNQ